MPLHFMFAPIPVLNDKSKALNIGTKLIMKIKAAPGARNTHPIKFCFLLSVIFFDLLKKTPSFSIVGVKKGNSLQKLFPCATCCLYYYFFMPPCPSAKSASRLRRMPGVRPIDLCRISRLKASLASLHSAVPTHKILLRSLLLVRAVAL